MNPNFTWKHKILNLAAENKRLVDCKKNWFLGMMLICITTINAFFFLKTPQRVHEACLFAYYYKSGWAQGFPLNQCYEYSLLVQLLKKLSR